MGLRRRLHVLRHRLSMWLRRRPRIVPGQTLDVEIAAPWGVIQATAETRLDGETLVIEQVAIYRRGARPTVEPPLATRWLLREVRRVEEAACVFG